MVENGIRKYLPSSMRRGGREEHQEKTLLSSIDYKGLGKDYYGGDGGEKLILFERIITNLNENNVFESWNYLTVSTCVIYAISMLSGGGVGGGGGSNDPSFKEIIEKIILSKAPKNHETDWFRRIVVKGKKDAIDIITFYNFIFLPIAGDYIRHVHSTILSKRDEKIVLKVVNVLWPKRTKVVYSFRSV